MLGVKPNNLYLLQIVVCWWCHQPQPTLSEPQDMYPALKTIPPHPSQVKCSSLKYLCWFWKVVSFILFLLFPSQYQLEQIPISQLTCALTTSGFSWCTFMLSLPIRTNSPHTHRSPTVLLLLFVLPCLQFSPLQRDFTETLNWKSYALLFPYYFILFTYLNIVMVPLLLGSYFYLVSRTATWVV